MPRAGTKPKASFNTFSGSQLLHSSMHTLICCTNAAELSHCLGKGNTTPCYSYKHFPQPWFPYLSPQPNSSTRSLYPNTWSYGTAALQGLGAFPAPGPRWPQHILQPPRSCLGQSFSTLGKTHSQKLSGVRGGGSRGIITTQLQLLLQTL